MPEIGLSAYLDEAKELMRTNALDEAIAICRHILKQHPKYIEAYRVLAEASLEKGEHEEALDLFKRVLSADPENLIAYIGLGIIYNEDGLSDEAIWQFERAFEISPGNAEIRRELKRLYTQRDGVEQPRLKLNRPALARLYAKGGFYAQAVTEFQSILSGDPERIDIQLALAETLWYGNRKREAAEVCQDILNKLPHCLKANLLLGEIWLRSGLEEDGNTLLKRAEGLDPENKRAHEMFGEMSPLPSKAVNIEKLSNADLAAATIGTTGKEPAAAERLDDWMQALKTPPMAEPSAADRTVILPETALRQGALDQKPFAAPIEAPKPGVRGGLTGLAEGEESPVIESLEKEFGALPALTAAPLSEEEQTKIAASMPPETASAEEIMAWLRQQSFAPAPVEETPVIVPGVEEEQAAPAAKHPTEEGSPVIAALEAEFGALPELTAAPVSEAEQAEIAASMPPETASAEEIMAWLRQQTAAPEPPIETPAKLEATTEETIPGTEDMLAWLRAAPAVIPIEEEAAPQPVIEEPVVEMPAPVAEEAKEPEAVAPAAEDLMAWLRAAPTVIPIEEEAAPQPVIEEPVAEAPAPVAEEVKEPEVVAPAAEDLLAWLRATPAVIPVEEEAAPQPVIEEPVAEAPAPVAEEAKKPEVVAPAAEDMLAWLRATPAVIPLEEEAAPQPVIEEPVVEAPAPVAEESREPEAVAPGEKAAPQPMIEEPVVEALATVAEEVTAPQPVAEAPTLVVEPVTEAAPVAPPTTIEHYLTVLAADPTDHSSRLALADAFAQEARWSEAAEQYGQLLRSTKPLDALIGNLVTLTEAHPEQFALQQVLGDAYMEAGRFDEAMAKYNWLLNKI